MNTVYINSDDPKSVEEEHWLYRWKNQNIEEIAKEPKSPLNRNNGQMADS